MKCNVLALIAVGSVLSCFATTLSPFARECALLDRVLDAASAETPERDTALQLLERVAEGRVDTTSPQIEEQIGLRLGQLHTVEFKDPTVRAYAISRIGNVALPEALTYLQSLKKSEIGPDRSGEIWPAAVIALHQALVNRIPDERGRIAYLEETLKERSAAASWAVDQLCNRGIYDSKPFVRSSILRRNAGPDGEKDFRFCEARMEIIARNPDRISALGSFLKVATGASDHQLIGWAIQQLYSMRAPRADAELARYAEEAGKLADDSPQKRALQGHAREIRDLLERRSK